MSTPSEPRDPEPESGSSDEAPAGKSTDRETNRLQAFRDREALKTVFSEIDAKNLALRENQSERIRTVSVVLMPLVAGLLAGAGFFFAGSVPRSDAEVRAAVQQMAVGIVGLRSETDKRLAAIEKLDLSDASVALLRGRIEALDHALSTDTERVLELALLRRDLDSVTAGLDRVSDQIAAVETRQSDELNRIVAFFGAGVAAIVALSVAVVTWALASRGGGRRELGSDQLARGSLDTDGEAL